MPASSCARVVAEADRCPCVERGCKGVWSAAYSASGGGSTKPRMLGRMHEFAPSEQQSKIAQRGYVEHHASSRMLRPLRLYLELLLVMHRPRHGTQAPHATGQRLVRSGSHQPLVMALAAQRPARPRSGSADVQHGSTLLRLVSMVPTVWSTRAELCRPPRNIQPGDRWSSSQERESLLPSIVTTGGRGCLRLTYMPHAATPPRAPSPTPHTHTRRRRSRSFFLLQHANPPRNAALSEVCRRSAAFADRPERPRTRHNHKQGCKRVVYRVLHTPFTTCVESCTPALPS